MKKTLVFAVMICLSFGAFAQNTPPKKPATPVKKPAPVEKVRLVEIKTNFGTMVLKLYNETPLHRDNFIKLVQEKFYDGVLFHRIIEGFMIQGGDPNSINAADSVMLGNGEAPGDRIPAEFKNNLIHKKGALAAARDNNPEKASSNCQFYIVQGKKTESVDEMNMMECNVRSANPSFTYTSTQRNLYKTIGGTSFLDQNYTVFGEVVKGLEVIDKIAAMPKDSNDRPLQNISMTVRMLN